MKKEKEVINELFWTHPDGGTMADCISRKAVLNDIGELFTLCHETLPNECGHHFIVEKELETHWDFVKNLPAADVRSVKRGEWIPVGNVFPMYKCNNCNSLSLGGNYCPNCGADMREIGK